MYFSLTHVTELQPLPTAGIVAAGAVAIGTLAGTVGYVHAKVLKSADPKGAIAYHGVGTAAAVIAGAIAFETTSATVANVVTNILPRTGFLGDWAPLYGMLAGGCAGAFVALTAAVATKVLGGKAIANAVNHPVSWTYALFGDLQSMAMQQALSNK